ncbi:hypothetical protein J2X69_003036 [Algoriphagus sp. 4150]|uniref:hypothetical protein n=1 Tax=Algoriphagus sp. 4150 TaxID=2817756 RepID=UPI002865886E|nr:hypothetical protein [Algoriphagus sp. 4150]MDR7130679.1 hypothetical protein [Algoriphagus sp. 4150]
MASVSEFISETKDAIFERIKNPFLGSLFFFWTVWNWQYWAYIIFGSNTLEFRIERSPVYMNWWYLTVLPLVLAIGYTLGSSYVFNWIESKSKSGIEERRRNYYVRLKTDYSLRKEAAQEKYNLKKIEEGITQLDELKVENNDLKVKIEGLNSDVSNERQNLAKRNKDLENVNSNLDSIIKLINYDFQFDLRDKKIERLLKITNEDDLEVLGLKVKSLFPYERGQMGAAYMNTAKELLEGNFIKYTTGNFSDEIVELELTSLGKYVLRRSLYSSDKLDRFNLNFDKKDFKVVL